MTRREFAAETTMRPDVRALLASRGIDIEARERQAQADIRAGRRKPPKPTPAPKSGRSSTPRRDAARQWLDAAN